MTDDKFKVRPWMMNPFNPPKKIYWLICPTHQVCVMALCKSLKLCIAVEKYGECFVFI